MEQLLSHVFIWKTKIYKSMYRFHKVFRICAICRREGGSKRKYPRMIKSEINSTNREVMAGNTRQPGCSEEELQRLNLIPLENFRGEDNPAAIWAVPSCTQGTPQIRQPYQYLRADTLLKPKVGVGVDLSSLTGNSQRFKLTQSAHLRQ